MLFKFLTLLIILNSSQGLDLNSSKDISTESCEKSPCQNEADCVPLPDGDHFCKCLDNYGGKHCQIENPCKENSCQNGAKCKPTSRFEDKAFICECQPGFSGEFCEKKNDCDEKSCINGNCVEENGNQVCSCLIGFTGIMCELQLDPCSGNPCKNDGLCIKESHDRFSCLCLPGYFGKNCAEIDPCSSTPCKNRGECRSLKLGSETVHTCSCKPDFYGTHCEKENPCVKEPCKNYGLCKFDRDTEKASCICFKGFTGANCESKIEDTCSCLNGGTCFLEQLEGKTSEKCLCPSCHYGPKCEHRNPCSSSPCKNDGLCKYDVKSEKISCLCMKGFMGELCDQVCEDKSKICKLANGLNLCSTTGSQCKKTCGLCE
ncbi:neurogenic locus notch -like protein, partial [Brachionus plicatilis]